MKRMIKVRLPKILKKEGAFLLEAMIGTAILSLVLVFFALVSMSAYLLMQKAYHETQIAEDVFLKIESRQYSELSSDQSSLPISEGSRFVMGVCDNSDTAIIDDEYVRYVAADGAEGILDSTELSDNNFSKEMFSDGLYAFRYHLSNEDYQAVFYILKGEK